MPLVLGVDSSTQSTKVEVRDLHTGERRALASSAHPPTTPPISEQDPLAWWGALCAAIGQLGPLRSEVVAMSVAGQQHGLVLIDAAGDPVRPAKLWNDTTSAPQAGALVEALGAQTWAEACGSLPVAAFTVAKLAWVAEREPEVLARTAKVMLPHDYLTWRLTGEHVTDRGDASGTGWFDPEANEYRPELLAASGVDATWIDRLPSVRGPLDEAGTLTPDVAAELGLSPDVIVGPGTGDNMGAALGLGLRTGDVVISLGTSGTAYSVAAAPTHDRSGHVAGFADAAGGFLPLVCTLNATKVTDTVARWLGTDAAGLGQLALAAANDPQADEAGAGPILVPYFDGERTPNLPDATGSFHGLSNTTTREQLALAAHDGVLCGLLDGVTALERAGVATSGRLLLIGGGARSAAYRRRCADLTGSSVLVPDTDEAVATGASLQAAAVHERRNAVELGDEWGLGAGSTTDPTTDASSVRNTYADATATIST